MKVQIAFTLRSAMPLGSSKNHIWLQDHSVAKPYEMQEEESSMLIAAESINEPEKD